MNATLALPDELRDARPPVKLVWVVLRRTDARTVTDIADRTGMHPSTVRRALRKLEDRGLAEQKQLSQSVREKPYRVTD
jgi:DNA-binding MarR family transcriptional regulator